MVSADPIWASEEVAQRQEASSALVEVCAYQVHELLAGVFVFQESAGEFRGCRDGVLFLDTSHTHAEVLGFDDDGHAHRVQDLLQTVFDLGGQSFLQLQAAGEAFYHAWDLTQSDNGAVGDVADVGLAKERQHVVFAQRIDLDVLYNDNLFVVLMKKSAFQDFLGVLAVAVGQEIHGFGDTHGGLDQSLTGGVFSKM